MVPTGAIEIRWKFLIKMVSLAMPKLENNSAYVFPLCVQTLANHSRFKQFSRRGLWERGNTFATARITKLLLHAEWRRGGNLTLDLHKPPRDRRANVINAIGLLLQVASETNRSIR